MSLIMLLLCFAYSFHKDDDSILSWEKHIDQIEITFTNNGLYHLQTLLYIIHCLSDALLSTSSHVWNSLADNDICLREDGNSSL